MNVLIVSSSPNKDGLTAACAAAAVEGVLLAGVHAEEVRLNDLQVGMCQACGNSWGACDAVVRVAELRATGWVGAIA